MRNSSVRAISGKHISLSLFENDYFNLILE